MRAFNSRMNSVEPISANSLVITSKLPGGSRSYTDVPPRMPRDRAVIFSSYQASIAERTGPRCRDFLN